MSSVEAEKRVMAYSKDNDVRLAALVPDNCYDDLNGEKLNATITDSTVTIEIEVQANRTYWIDKIDKVLTLFCVNYDVQCLNYSLLVLFPF